LIRYGLRRHEDGVRRGEKAVRAASSVRLSAR
jgi:hypothetical protein